MKANAAAEGAGVLDGNEAAGVDGGLGISGRLGEYKLASEFEERILFAARAGKERAHGNRRRVARQRRLGSRTFPLKTAAMRRFYADASTQPPRRELG